MAVTTFTHPECNIAITLPSGLSQKQLFDFHPFTSWLSTLQATLALQHINPSHPFHQDPYRIRSITIQSFDSWHPDRRIGFLKLTSRITNSAAGGGEYLPGAVFLRGPSVAMLVILVPDDAPDDSNSDERYVLLTVQPRVAAGSLEFVEIPAGMVDERGVFAGTAAREIEEELGIIIDQGELVDLTALAVGGAADGAGEDEGDDGAAAAGEAEEGEEKEAVYRDGQLPKAVYPSPGACDEYIPIFMHERRVPRSQLSEWTGKLTGLREEGEKIMLKLVRMQDLWKVGARDGKTLAAVALWEGLRREGRI